MGMRYLSVAIVIILVMWFNLIISACSSSQGAAEVPQATSSTVRFCFYKRGVPVDTPLPDTFSVTGVNQPLEFKAFGTYDGECQVVSYAEAEEWLTTGGRAYGEFLKYGSDICIEITDGYLDTGDNCAADDEETLAARRNEPDDPDMDGIAHGIIGVTTVDNGTAYWKPIITGPESPAGHRLSEYSLQWADGRTMNLNTIVMLHTGEHVVFDARGEQWSLVYDCFGFYEENDVLNERGLTDWMQRCSEGIVTDTVCADYPDSPLCANVNK